MDLNTRKILSLFASILLTIPVYIILHEGGHALIALLSLIHIWEEYRLRWFTPGGEIAPASQHPS